MRIVVASSAGDHLALTFLGWLVEVPDNPVDAALLATEVDVVAGPFAGRYTTELRREDLSSWRDELALLDADFRPGEASFRMTLEHSLGFVVTVGNTGRLFVDGWALHRDGSGFEQRLEFTFPIDSSLRQLLREVDGVLLAYPDRALS